jgi:hypothetical protein
MFGRIFGRGKDEPDQAVCAQCGRTLLVGEWTQNVVGADGEEHLICSLCGQNHTFDADEPVSIGTTPANNGRVRESLAEVPPAAGQMVAPAAMSAAAYDDLAPEPEPVPEKRDARGESDAFWKALKEKDAAIERLQAQLERAEAEKQELAGQLALVRAQTAEPAYEVPREPLVPAAAAAAAVAYTEPEPAYQPPVVPEPAAARPTGDASEPGERTWGETPAEFAAELAALRDEEAALSVDAPPVAAPGQAVPAAAAVAAAADVIAADHVPADEAVVVTAPAADQAALAAEPAGAAVREGVPAVVFESTQPIPAVTDDMIDEAAPPQAEYAGEEPQEAETTLTPAPVAAAAVEPPPAEPTQAELEAEAASLTLLQRGVDLLNVSQVPHKIAETSEQLGLPLAHVGFDGHTTAVTFMWSMGWYRFHVDAESGAVRMDERGYDEIGLRPNAGVRADGTVQLAPAQISRAAAQRPQPEPQPAEAPVGPAAAPAEPEPPSAAAQKAPEILSKSLLGQRSDDDAASWEKTQARDFDWNR